ncbi:MAG: AAA family ATPase [Bacteroidales bacterium]
MPFEGQWRSAIGRPELSGVWMIWGSSGNGKTSFAMQLAKYLSTFCKVAYNSLEEGFSESLKRSATRAGMTEGDRRIVILSEKQAELEERLKADKKLKIVFIDSLQYFGLKASEVDEFLNRLDRKVLLIFISHAEGKEPKGKTAQSLRYHSNVKIFVQGYKAFTASRYAEAPPKPYVVWEEGASEFWGGQDL